MATRDRGTSAPKSKARREKKRSNPAPPDAAAAAATRALSDREDERRQQGLPDQSHAASLPPQSSVAAQSGPARAPAARLGTGGRIRTPRPSVSLASEPAVAPVPSLGTGRRTRTPLPPIGRAEQAGAAPRRLATARRPRTPTPSARGAAAQPTQRLGAGTRVRTALPEALPGELEEIHFEAIGTGPLGKKLKEKAEQFGHVQELLQHPGMFDLQSKVTGTSSTPEEIEARKGEVRYQIKIMQSMLAVLNDELTELEQAKPQNAAPPSPSHSQSG
jgi:hypothetical protein